MSTVTCTLPASPDRVFQALEDARLFEHLVVGARRIRRFDARWPEPGTQIHHTIGLPPFIIRDQTVVLEAEPPTRLVLEALVRPFGHLTIEFDLSANDGGTTLQIVEKAVKGIGTWPLLRIVVDHLITLRNHELARRLTDILENHQQQRVAAGG